MPKTRNFDRVIVGVIQDLTKIFGILTYQNKRPRGFDALLGLLPDESNILLVVALCTMTTSPKSSSVSLYNPFSIYCATEFLIFGRSPKDP